MKVTVASIVKGAMTFSVTAFSLMGFVDYQQNGLNCDTQHNGLIATFSITSLSMTVSSAVMLSVIMLNVVMLSVVASCESHENFRHQLIFY
jgi:hypothetical protein